MHPIRSSHQPTTYLSKSISFVAVLLLLSPAAMAIEDDVSGSVSNERGVAGGGAQADFDSLIELITTTINPTTWEEVGGLGAIQGFEGGVYVNSDGVLQQVPTEVTERLRVWQRSLREDRGNRDVHAQVPLRKVSLTRLQRELQRRQLAGEPPDLAMRYLAGLTKVRFLALQPSARETAGNEIILAGPAGDWAPGPQGQAVSAVDGRPVLLLDDLVVLIRNAYQEEGRFGCSITPRQQNLAETQAFLSESARHPLKPGHREDWLEEVRGRMGRQDITVYGVDPATAVARVLVEADYHMKLVGMGLAEGVPGVASYLQRVEPDDRGQIPPLSVLRWWFTLDYDAILSAPDRHLFALQGPAVQVLSENEFLTRHGRRVHTGRSDVWNKGFAKDFTEHFERLAEKYPCYARLRNIFDLAMVAALLRHEDLSDRADGGMSYFLATGADSGHMHRVGLAAVPAQVDTVISHRMIDRRQIVAGVSGGVTVRSGDVLQQVKLQPIQEPALLEAAQRTVPEGLGDAVWWWD